MDLPFHHVTLLRFQFSVMRAISDQQPLSLWQMARPQYFPVYAAGVCGRQRAESNYEEMTHSLIYRKVPMVVLENPPDH